MRNRNKYAMAGVALRLCLTLGLLVQLMMPGLAVAAAPAGPVVPAVLCGEHGPVEVLIDLATGEPVEESASAICPDCLTCCNLVLVFGSAGLVMAPEHGVLASSLDGAAAHHGARPKLRPAARSPPKL